MTHATAFGVDVGFGNTKATFRIGSAKRQLMFPSLAKLTPENSGLTSSFGEYNTSHRTTNVLVDGNLYEVGPGVQTSNAWQSRAQADDYPLSAVYAALLGGAFKFANITSVEQLVLGLPVHTVQKYKAALAAKFTGKQNFGDFEIEVGSVSVLPQPIGTLLSVTQAKVARLIPDTSVLLVDVGYFTTDWVVMRDNKIDSSRSYGITGGASKVYRKIAERIGAQTNKQVNGIERIDNALRESRAFTVHGESYDIATDYLPAALAVVDPVVKEIQNRVGDAEDIAEIWLSGGGAQLYLEALKRAYPSITMQIVPNPCFANSEGFFIAGEAASRRPAVG